jgi:hypothetical protein
MKPMTVVPVVVHPSVTEKRVIQLMKDELYSLANPGICLNCGADHDACEPDATNYECDDCGEHLAFGAAAILVAGDYHKCTDPDTEV